MSSVKLNQAWAKSLDWRKDNPEHVTFEHTCHS